MLLGCFKLVDIREDYVIFQNQKRVKVKNKNIKGIYKIGSSALIRMDLDNGMTAEILLN